jgi:tetratricopeptide (TPR) repeat protein
MFTVTFYSYKGGVGRTSALMNLASRLCNAGRTVCILDFDLEAPGLDSFDSSFREDHPPGLVEYIKAYYELGSAPVLSDFSYDVTPNGSDGKLILMSSGRKDAAYRASLSRLDWKYLYKKNHGFFLIESLKRSIEKEFAPDYLLVDSRTGLTDVSGICTQQLPDLVVLFFNLNKQNIDGTAQVYRSIVDNRINRSIQTLLVASPIPDIPESMEIRSNRFDQARQQIGRVPDLVIPYDPFVCFRETIISEKEPRALAKAYGELTDRVVSMNDKDVTTLLKKAISFRDSGEFQLANVQYKEITETYPSLPQVWFEYGNFCRIAREPLRAKDYYRKAADLSTASVWRDRALGELALTELKLGERGNAKQSYLRLVESAGDARQLTRISEAFADQGEAKLALIGLSRVIERFNDLSALFAQGQALASLKKYSEAYEAYRMNLKDDSSLSAIFNAGYAAVMAGQISEGSPLLSRAIEMFESSKAPRNSAERANVLSAISFAYEHVGNKDKAIDLLQNCVRDAEGIDGRIFLFPEYRFGTKVDYVKGITTRLKLLMASGTRQLTEKVPKLRRPVTPRKHVQKITS